MMSVKQANVIDGMGVDRDTNTLVFLITDPYTWAVQEYEHLKAIQTKINNYVRYIESRGYREHYRNREFDGFRIEIVFKYPFTANGQAFLSAGKKQLLERNIDFIYSVAKGENP